MSRKAKIAAIQMELTPAPTLERLARAEKLVADAVAAGAQIVVLPELFNTGYTYDPSNYEKAETMSGKTVTWMKAQAIQHHIYLNGSLLLLDGDHVYNAALLFAPDGNFWRYDKQYPFAWERAFFREGKGITIADTEFGKLGMMICWDSAHEDVWQRYAGRVDAMLITSCPPLMQRADVIFSDGTRLNMGDFAPYDTSDEAHFAEKYIDEQAAWLGVPMVHTSGSGKFRSPLPLPLASLSAMLAPRPDLWHKFFVALQTTIEADTGYYAKIVDASGEVIARVTQDGDSFTLATVDIPEKTPMPQDEQPPMRTPSGALLAADVLAPMMLTGMYQRGVRQQWGNNMAPLDFSTKLWLAAVSIAFVIGAFLGQRTRRK